MRKYPFINLTGSDGVLSRFGGLFALIVVLLGTAQSSAEDCRLIKIAELPLQQNASNRPAVEVLINGTPRRFLVDTGGAYTGISERAVEELGLSTQEITRINLFMLNGQKIKRFAKVDLVLGKNRDQRAQLVVFPDGILPADLDGILSPDYLANFDLDFDFGLGVLNLMSQDHCDGKVVYWTKDYADIPFEFTSGDHKIQMPVTLDGKELSAILDTGAMHTILSPRAAKTKFDLTDETPNIVHVDDPRLIRFGYRFERLELGGLALKKPLIFVRSDAAEKAIVKDSNHRVMESQVEGQNLLVGMDVWSRLHFYIAYKERKLYVSPAKKTVPSASTPDAVPPNAAAN